MGVSQLTGKPMWAVERCHCARIVNFNKEPKPKKVYTDGKAAAIGE